MVYFLIFFILLFPFIFIPGYYNYTIYKFVFLNAFTVILWIVFLLKKKTLYLHKITLAEIYLIGFILFLSISTIFSIDVMQSLNGSPLRYEGYPVFIAYVSLFFFTYRFVGKEKLSLLFKCFVGISFVIAIYGILQHFLIDPLPRIASKEGGTRSYGFFGNPDFYGSFVTLMLPFSLMLYLSNQSKRMNAFYLLSASTIFLSLLYSETRSGWLGSFIGFVLISFLFILKRREYWRKYALISFCFLFILIGVNLGWDKETESKLISNRIETTFTQVHDDVQKGGSGRFFIWYKSLPLIGQYWLHGSGPDTFGQAFPNGTKEVKAFFGNAYVDKAHNEYIQIAVTLGIPTLIFYLLFLSEIIKTNLKAYLKLPVQDKILAVTLMASIIGYIIQAFFNISVLMVAPYFWILLGLSYRLTKNDKV